MDTDFYLNGIWRFCIDPNNIGISQEWMAQENQPYLEEKQKVFVPSCWDREDNSEFKDYRGVAWYWRDFHAPITCFDKKTSLYFSRIAHSATIYIDGKELASYEGSFLPFEVDISEYIDNSSHFIAVRVDSTVNASKLLFPTATLPFSGICGDIIIRPQDDIIVEDRSIETILHYDTAKNQIRYAELTFSLYIKNRGSADFSGRLTIELSRDFLHVLTIEKEIEVLKQNSRLSKTLLHIDEGDLDLWSPMSPKLYDLRLSIQDNDGNKVMDIIESIGVREIEIEGDTISLNGKMLEIVGCEFTIDAPQFGYCLPLTAIEDRINKIKAQGVNLIRASQGTFSRDIVGAASRIGVLVVQDVPLIPLSLAEKQSFFNLFAYENTFLPALAAYSIHPSVNRSEAKTARVYSEIQKLFNNRLDPSRYFVESQYFGAKKWYKCTGSSFDEQAL